MSSHTIVLRAEAGPFRTVVLSEGVGIFMPTDILRELAVKDRLLRAILLRYVDVCERQFLESAVSIGRYTIPQRLARWILMWQDRAELDTSDITHDVLAEMLGVRRPSITDAIHVLEGKGSIKSTRGQIAIRDRSRLRRVAGASYSTVC